MADTAPQFPIIRGRTVRVDDNGLVCLNDIWSAANFSKNQAPTDWRRLPMSTRLELAVLERITGKSRNYTKNEMRSVAYSVRGAGGGTFADVRLALAYAEYLNPKLALEVREVFLRYKAADATLADEVLERATPEANEWAARRAMGRVVRRGFTDTLQAHGCIGQDYPSCTNAIYGKLFDKTAAQLKRARGVTKKGNLRDKMTTKELAFVMASEALSSERIEEERCEGGTECQSATATSAGYIRQAIEADRKNRRGQQPSLI